VKGNLRYLTKEKFTMTDSYKVEYVSALKDTLDRLGLVLLISPMSGFSITNGRDYFSDHIFVNASTIEELKFLVDGIIAGRKVGLYYKDEKWSGKEK
jgi:hypothetical protein